jgi:uncharacterized membrane protein YedE/YeeE
MNIIDFISQPWHWAVGGLAIAGIVFLLLYAGERFGVSSSFDTICSMGGAGRWIDHFAEDWRKNTWLLVFIIGVLAGGYLGVSVFQSPEPVQIAADTEASLSALGVSVPQSKADGLGFIPEDVFTFSNLLTLKGFILMIVGGFLVGFGTRYAGGCTSGHAISGMSNLQPASLVATIGFFIGGLIATHLLFPVIFNL